MRHCRRCLSIAAVLSLACGASVTQAETLEQEAEAGLRRAIAFYHKQVAAEGGYLWRYSADLKLREGEGKASTTTIWVQPPGTPSVGMAMLRAYERTGEAAYLDAARDAGMALVRCQLHSGGWNDGNYFDAETRKKYAYRVDGPPSKKAKNNSAFDDNRTQAAVRFLARLDKAEGFKNKAIHDATQYALDAIAAVQHHNGGWSQVWSERKKLGGFESRNVRASIPPQWPREHPGGDYWWHYTLNDHAMCDTIEMFLDLADVYANPRDRGCAIRGGEFLIKAQLPEPQPGWAQQYDLDMHPAWARKFEPPAVSGSESQRVLLTLIRLYGETGDEQFLKPVPSAIAWMKRSLLPDGQLARFYELGTNKPLYFTQDYKLTYDDTDLPTHYAFKVRADVAKIEQAYARALAKEPEPEPAKPSEEQVRKVLAGLDERGAWVEQGTLKYHKIDGPVIASETFVRNVDVLSRYLAKE